jgi:hypothetical protein
MVLPTTWLGLEMGGWVRWHYSPGASDSHPNARSPVMTPLTRGCDASWVYIMMFMGIYRRPLSFRSAFFA